MTLWTSCERRTHAIREGVQRKRAVSVFSGRFDERAELQQTTNTLLKVSTKPLIVPLKKFPAIGCAPTSALAVRHAGKIRLASDDAITAAFQTSPPSRRPSAACLLKSATPPTTAITAKANHWIA